MPKAPDPAPPLDPPRRIRLDGRDVFTTQVINTVKALTRAAARATATTSLDHEVKCVINAGETFLEMEALDKKDAAARAAAKQARAAGIVGASRGKR